jgi:GNAT superfamily N-acetyltransferase
VLTPETKLKLRPVNAQCSADLGFLYGVLIERLKDPDSNISHKAMPSWEDHVAYLHSGVYQAHYLAVLGAHDDICIGHCYVDKDDHVGVYIHPLYRRRGFATWMLGELIKRHPPPLYANVNRHNMASLKLFDAMGFRLHSTPPVQVTLKLGVPPA